MVSKGDNFSLFKFALQCLLASDLCILIQQSDNLLIFIIFDFREKMFGSTMLLLSVYVT